MIRLRFVLSCLLGLVFTACSDPTRVSGQDFRVDNELRLLETDRKPVKSTTYFRDNDFVGIIGTRGEITCYDSKTQILVLLDPVLRIQTHLSATATRDEANAERKRRENHAEPLTAFVAQPRFIEEWDAALGELALQSPWIDYRLTTGPFPDRETERKYLDFCDCSCYLNYRVNGSPIALVRLEVNRILRERHLFPREISFSFFPKGKGFLAREEKIRTTHQIVRRPGDADRKRLAEIDEFRRSFTTVSFEEYQKKVREKLKTDEPGK